MNSLPFSPEKPLLNVKLCKNCTHFQKAQKTCALYGRLNLIDGAIEQLPDWAAARLDDNGRLVTGLVEHGVTRLAAGRKAGGAIALMPLADLGIPVLPQFAAPKRWSF